MLPIKSIISIKSIKVIGKSINIDFSQQIRLSIFIDYRYNQLILSILSIAQAGLVGYNRRLFENGPQQWLIWN